MIRQIGRACTGCFACMGACPVGCISVESRELGHTYPSVDETACIECEECLRVCHAFGDREIAPFGGKAFAAQAKDEKLLLDSSSGAIFSVVARELIERGGVVYGAAWERGSAARHIRVDSAKELDRLRRSKYVQSDTRGVFEVVKDDLTRGLIVLFSGVPCQVAALYEYLGAHPDNLITLDLICHGVPSGRLFEEYLSWLEGDMESEVVEYRSRDKVKAGWSYLGSIRANRVGKHASESYFPIPVDDPYTLLFNSGADFRESCYECRYANGDRVGDITLGDFWGIEPLRLPVELQRGVSAVLANTRKGESVIMSLESDMRLFEVEFSDVARKNHNLNGPSVRPEIREQVTEAYGRGGFGAVVPVIRKACRRDVLKNRIKRMIPIGLKTLIKKRS